MRGENEPLSGGGKSSGLLSFLKIGDRAAGAIKSGGTTRRAAKMVIVDIDHPDIEKFIDWKVVEEQKVAALVAGSILCRKHLNIVMQAWHAKDEAGRGRQRPRRKPTAKPSAKPRRGRARGLVWPALSGLAEQGEKTFDFPIYDTDWEGEAYFTVSGQNANNSVRMSNGFIKAVQKDKDWNLTRRVTARQQDPQGRASCGSASAKPHGPAPTPACSTTPPSTSGTPAPTTAASTAPTRAPSTCSWTTRPATWHRSTCCTS